MKKDLFEPIVPDAKMHPSFKALKDSLGHRGARQLMNEFFSLMGDRDGNFKQQFQTTGFDARTFELGLYSYFLTADYKIELPESPDFIIENNHQRVAIEAVTSNPPETLRFKNTISHMEHLTVDEIEKKIEDEVPIKMGSPLFSKLQKKYWELPICKDIPIILAIQAFHEPGSLLFTDAGLANYLYGFRQYPTWSEDGQLVINDEPIDTHSLGKKIIPSHFFGQPETENISGVLFSNSMTVSKFSRMGKQMGLYPNDVKLTRSGSYFNPDSSAHEALTYEYIVGDPSAHVETWPEGLHLFLNPNAKTPVSESFLKGVTTSAIIGGHFLTSHQGFHPLTSVTIGEILKR